MDPASPETVKGHCDAIAASDIVVLKALTALSEYGKALKAVADQGGYSGSNLKDAANDVATLVKTFPSGSSAAGVLKSIGDPLTDLTNFLFERWAESELRNGVKRGAPAVNKILVALGDYLAAVGLEYDRESANKDQSLALLDTEMGKLPPNDPMRTITFTDFIRHTEDALARQRKTLDHYKDLVKQLVSAETALKSAADDKDHEASLLKDTLGAVATAFADTNAVLAAVRGKDAP
jgi:hypothetical protein